MDEAESGNSIHTLSAQAALEMVVDSPWAIGKLSPDGYFDWCNEAYLSILGCPGRPTYVINTHHRDWIHSEDVEEDERQFSAIRDGELPGYFCRKRYRVRGPAGRWRWGLLSCIGAWKVDEETKENIFDGYHVQFMPVDDYELQGKAKWPSVDKLKALAAWLWMNRKKVALVAITATSIISALIARDWSVLLDLLRGTDNLQDEMQSSP